MTMRIGEKSIGPGFPTYFVADIAANHDGSLARAKSLIRMAAEAGADAAKFQHFSAPTIVSEYGFESLHGVDTHQADWTKSVFDVYQDASVPHDWTAQLSKACAEVGITFLSTPYDFAAVDALNPYVPAFKIGSGDITWIDFLTYVAEKRKPMILATGASTLDEIKAAFNAVSGRSAPVMLLQCNTNYTGNDDENIPNLNLNAIKTIAQEFPDAVVGLSDHTQSDVVAATAVACGATMIERHFTDDRSRTGPDHRFSLDPRGWEQMVSAVRTAEQALGSTSKLVAPNEVSAQVVQRRCLRATRDLPPGTQLHQVHLEALRPAPVGSISPAKLADVLERTLNTRIKRGQDLRWEMLK